MKKWSIFYSWQSDLPALNNQKAIRDTIRLALSNTEDRIDDIKLEIDEATLRKPGSPDITESIFEKISEADIFIGDLTTINSDSQENSRKVPNPNVAIELGFAISELGWDRIILIFNKFHGDFPNDIPFDINRRRVTDCKIDPQMVSNGKGMLKKDLIAALETIIQKNPVKRKLLNIKNPQRVKRLRDIETITKLFEMVDFNAVNRFLDNLGYYFHGDIFYFFDGFNFTKRDRTIHIYDERANLLINEFHKLWDETLSYSHLYRPSSDSSDDRYFIKENDGRPHANQEFKKYHHLLETKNELSKIVIALIRHIKENFVEISINETNNIAQESYEESKVN